jgi:3-hydroxyethyl bacteriochlorophyllide a dehydrogenase
MHSMKAKAILFTGVGQVEMRDVQVPQPEKDEVLVEALYTCISPGTELRCLAGQQPGGETFPFIPGYAAVGRVIARGPEASLPVGTLVNHSSTARVDAPRLWGGHIELAVQPQSRVTPIPEGLDPLHAVVAKLAGIAYHGVRLSRALPEEQVAVVGLGPIGQLSARLHAATGARVVGADLSPARAQRLREQGIEAVVPADGLAKAFAEIQPRGADVVVDSTGSPVVLREAITLAKEIPWDDQRIPGARLLIQGSYPNDFCLPYQEVFAKELTILVPRNVQSSDLEAVLDLMHRGRLKVRDLVSDVRPPEAAADAYRELRESRDGMTVVFRWG